MLKNVKIMIFINMNLEKYVMMFVLKAQLDQIIIQQSIIVNQFVQENIHLKSYRHKNVLKIARLKIFKKKYVC